MVKLETNEYDSYFQFYIQRILSNDKNVIENLYDSYEQARNILDNISDTQQVYQYSKDKWTVKEILQHLIDAERMLSCRALKIARLDLNNLAGFDENKYVLHSNANHRDFKNMLEEYSSIRKSTIHLYQSFTNEDLLKKGITHGTYMSVRALGYIISGHLLHHLEVLKNKYL